MMTDSLILVALEKSSEIVTVNLKDGNRKVQNLPFSFQKYYRFEVFLFSETNLICFLLDYSDYFPGSFSENLLSGFSSDESRKLVYF